MALAAAPAVISVIANPETRKKAKGVVKWLLILGGLGIAIILFIFLAIRFDPKGKISKWLGGIMDPLKLFSGGATSKLFDPLQLFGDKGKIKTLFTGFGKDGGDLFKPDIFKMPTQPKYDMFNFEKPKFTFPMSFSNPTTLGSNLNKVNVFKPKSKSKSKLIITSRKPTAAQLKIIKASQATTAPKRVQVYAERAKAQKVEAQKRKQLRSIAPMIARKTAGLMGIGAGGIGARASVISTAFRKLTTMKTPNLAENFSNVIKKKARRFKLF